MKINRQEESIFSSLRDGEIELSLILTDEDETIDDAILSWGSGDEVVEIDTRFRLRDVVDTLIDLNQMPAYNNAIDVDKKPIFDAMRAELADMIKRIDALKFAKSR